MTTADSDGIPTLAMGEPRPRARDDEGRATEGAFDASKAESSEALTGGLRATCERRYQEATPLASGGMGTIEVAMDQALRRRTAIKRIHEAHKGDLRTARMFVREAQVTGQLDHPNIVPVHELGVEDDRLFFTMKLVEGQTLTERIEAAERPLVRDELLELLDVVVKVCDALGFAHSRGVLHCDLKPANVMVGEFGQVYLMDWGVALHRADAPPQRAEGETICLLGTPSHMSPEQARGHLDRIDERSDVFAIGALIYHVLTGQPPFAADSFWATVLRAQLCEFTPAEELADHLPGALLRIVEKAMSPEPSARHASVGALRQALVQFMRGGEPFPALRFPAGTEIVREGDEGDAAYIIRSGRCDVLRGGERVRVMGPGEVFGETAILSRGPRTATVVALEECECHVITASTFEGEVDAMKPWMGAFVRTLAERFSER